MKINDPSRFLTMSSDQFDASLYLSSIPLFDALSPPERERLAQSGQIKRLTRGDMVLRAGEVCRALHVVVSGHLKAFVTVPTGKEKVIKLIGPRDSFGESEIFLDHPGTLNVQSLTDSVVLSLEKQSIFSAISRQPCFPMHMLGVISRQMQGLICDLEAYTLHTGLERLVGYLLSGVSQETYVNGGSLKVTLPANKATIASRLSLTPEYFSRVLHELEAKNVINIDKREIRICDVQRLISYGLAPQ